MEPPAEFSWASWASPQICAKKNWSTWKDVKRTKYLGKMMKNDGGMVKNDDVWSKMVKHDQTSGWIEIIHQPEPSLFWDSYHN